MNFNVKRVGSFGDSKVDNVVRLNKGDRDHLGVRSNALIKVKKGDKTVLALVGKQFKDLASYPETCSVNKLLAKILRLQESDTIEITANVTQEEADEYTSQTAFEERQVTGAVLIKKERKHAKDIMQRLDLFENEQNPEPSSNQSTTEEETDE